MLGALFDFVSRRRDLLPASCALLAFALALPLPSAQAEGGAPTAVLLAAASAVVSSVGVGLAGDAMPVFWAGLGNAHATIPVPETNPSNSLCSSCASAGACCPLETAVVSAMGGIEAASPVGSAAVPAVNS
jgi:hypothetical protein